MANIHKQESQPVHVENDMSPIRAQDLYRDTTFLSQDDSKGNRELGTSSFYTALNRASGPVSTANANRAETGGAFSQSRKSGNYQKFLSINSSANKTPDMK